MNRQMRVLGRSVVLFGLGAVAACSQGPAPSAPEAVGVTGEALSGSGSDGSGGGTGGKMFLGSSVDVASESVVLPLFEGRQGGAPVYYVVTDSSDANDAIARHVNYAPKLTNALGTQAVQPASVIGGRVAFAGTVDFSPTRQVTAGPSGFPPSVAVPGAIGDASYSPLVTTGNGIVLNATHVANASGQHDSVVSIDYAKHEVTMKLFFGLWNGHRLFYLHQEASSTVVAAAEGSTYAPNLDAAPGLASNDEKTSARCAILPIVNGPLGATNPERQGLQSALFGEGDPMNVTQEVPGSSQRYSPVWDVQPVVWTDAAIAAGQRHRILSASEIANLFQDGLVTSGGDGPANPSLKGLKAAGFISNCPVVSLF